LLYASIPLISAVCSLGLPNILQRYAPEYFSKKDLDLGKKLTIAACLIRICLTLLILTALFIFWDRIAHFIKIEEYKSYFAAFAVLIVAFQNWGLIKISLEAFFLHKQVLYFQIIAVSIRTVAYASCLFYQGGLFTILLIDININLFLLVSYVVIFQRNVLRPQSQPRDFDVHERRRIIKYGLFHNFNDIGMQFLGTGVTKFILAFLLDPVAVGIYSFCDQFARRIAKLSPIAYVSDVVRPTFFSFGAISGKERIKIMTNFITKYTYMFYIPLFCFILLAGKDLIHVAFGKYDEYHYILVTIMTFAMVNAIGFPIGLVAQLEERADIILYSKVFGIYNLIAAMFLINQWGVIGAVFATGTAVMLKNMFLWWFIRNNMSIKEPAKFIAQTFVYWAIITLIIYWLLSVRTPIYNLIATISTFSLAFLIYVLTICPIGHVEERMFESLVHKRPLLKPLLAVPYWRSRIRKIYQTPY